MEETSPVRQIDDALWVIDHPFVMPGGIELGARTTIIRLATGGLWLHSPGPLTPPILEWLERNGPVRDIVAPNLLHHLFLGEAVAAFPHAGVYGPAGLEKKITSDIALESLDPQKQPWSDDLGCLLVTGSPRMNEFVFLHRSSRTLILTDLAFNVRHSNSWLTRVFLQINGALGSFGPSRLARHFFLSDHSSVRRDIERILEWDFDRVIVSHGEVLEGGGPAALRKGYDWLLA